MTLIHPTATYSRSRTLDFIPKTVHRLLNFIPYLLFCVFVVAKLFRFVSPYVSPYVYVLLDWQLRKILALILTAQAKLRDNGNIVPDSPSSSSVNLVRRQGGAFRRTSTSGCISYVNDTRGLKPEGQPAGGGQRGSYTVEDELMEDDREQFEALKAYVHNLISSGAYMDQRITYYEQDKRDIKDIVHMATLKFPFLDNYQEQWPVKDIIKIRLRETRINKRKCSANSLVAAS